VEDPPPDGIMRGAIALTMDDIGIPGIVINIG
jgi:hypothetical protein